MSGSESIKVVLKDQENINSALKRFKRLCEGYGIVKEYRRRKNYTKPSLALKEKIKSADKRKRKTDIKDKMNQSKI